MIPPTPAEKSGKTLLIVAMAVGLVFEVARLVATMLSVSGGEGLSLPVGLLMGVLLRMAILLLLFLQTLEGKEWARILLAAVYLLGALFLISDLFHQIETLTVVSMALFTGLGAFLLVSTRIRAYIGGIRERQGFR